MSEYKVITQDYVNVQISTSKDDICFNEKRFQKGITIMNLKVFYFSRLCVQYENKEYTSIIA